MLAEYRSHFAALALAVGKAGTPARPGRAARLVDTPGSPKLGQAEAGEKKKQRDEGTEGAGAAAVEGEPKKKKKKKKT